MNTQYYTGYGEPAETIKKYDFGVYVGRFSPLHLGHCSIIKLMREQHGKDCVVLLGSCNNELSNNNPFTLKQRIYLLRSEFPGIRIMPLPDYRHLSYDDGSTWKEQLKLVISVFSKGSNIIYGGCLKDLEWAAGGIADLCVVERGEGISATEIRRRLDNGISFSDLIPNYGEPTKEDAEKLIVSWYKENLEKYEVLRR